jgi:hypothetical protein
VKFSPKEIAFQENVTKFFFENKKFVEVYSFSIFEVELFPKIQHPPKITALFPCCWLA